MSIDSMKAIQLDLPQSSSLSEVQSKAREAASEDNGDLRLIAWYDRHRSTGGPEPACRGEVPKCVRDYASSHGGETRVWVNDGAYEFYFAPTGKDVEELDPEWAINVHKGLDTDSHSNVQGG